MTREEAILLSAYTGFLLVQDFSDVHKFCEDALGRPIWTHEFADKDVQKEIQNKLRPQIMKLIQSTNALDKPRERGWPSDCRKCSLYDQEKGCTGRSVDSNKPMCHCMSRKRYDYLTREE